VEESGFDFRQDFSLLHNVQAGYGSHIDSYTMGSGGCFPGGKAGQHRHEADSSSPFSAEVKNAGAMPPLPIRLHAVVLNYLIPGIILPIPCS
jgi:hypothetical protein